MMQQWPYGANILIECTSTNIPENIDIGGADFITSRVKDTKMIFKYTEINGKLVEIESNLQTELRSKNKTFVVQTVNGGKTLDGEKPYINLCCNDVRIPLTFIDHDGSENKFDSIEIGENDITVYGGYRNNWVEFAKEITLNWNKTTTQQIYKGISKGSTYRAGYLACDASCLYINNNNEIKQKKISIWSLDQDQVPKKGQKVGMVTIPALNGKEKIKLYLNDNLISDSNLQYYKFFILGVQVKIYDGYTNTKHNTLYYVNGDNDNKIKTYDNTTFSKPITGKYYLKTTSDGFPVLNTNLVYKWNSDFFFVTTDESNPHYISPSTSEINVEYEIESKYTYEGDDDDGEFTCDCGVGDIEDNGTSCDCGTGIDGGCVNPDGGCCTKDAGEDDCNCDAGEDDCNCDTGEGDTEDNGTSCDCGTGDDHDGQVYAQNKYAGGATADTVMQVWSYELEDYVFTRNGGTKFVKADWYDVEGDCNGDPVISYGGGYVVLNYYSYDGSD